MAGAGGFEPPHDDTKNRCLTAWPRPNNINMRHSNEFRMVPQHGFEPRT